MKQKKLYFLALLAMSSVLVSCSSSQVLNTYSVGYQSIRTTFRQTETIPDNAEILVAYVIDEDGQLGVGVSNKTKDIMIIDQTMSFFVDSDGKSTSYYDPTVRQTSVTDISSNTTGGSVNLGAIGGALGVGGRLGTLLSGINVGESNTDGVSTTRTTYFADQPSISLAPKGTGAMSKVFKVHGIGRQAEASGPINLNNLSPDESYCRFSVCISYSLDGGATFKKIVTDFYANSMIVAPVRSTYHVNDALREIFATKPDALNECLWQLYFNSNHLSEATYKGVLYDYQ